MDRIFDRATILVLSKNVSVFDVASGVHAQRPIDPSFSFIGSEFDSNLKGGIDLHWYDLCSRDYRTRSN